MDNSCVRRYRADWLRMAAAAALQTHAGRSACESWEEAGKFPEVLRHELRDAMQSPISAVCETEVKSVLRTWGIAIRPPLPRVRAYPLFAEPFGPPVTSCSPDSPAG